MGNFGGRWDSPASVHGKLPQVGRRAGGALQQFGLGDAGGELRRHFVRVERDADRVFGEFAVFEIFGEPVFRHVVDLKLDLVPVRIEIVHRGRRPVVDAELRGDSVLVLKPVVGVHQVVEVFVGEGDMMQAAAHVLVRLDAGHGKDRDAVMLVVVGDERDHRRFHHEFALEHDGVPLGELFDVAFLRAEDEMGEFLRGDLAARPRGLRHPGDGVHGGSSPETVCAVFPVRFHIAAPAASTFADRRPGTKYGAAVRADSCRRRRRGRLSTRCGHRAGMDRAGSRP